MTHPPVPFPGPRDGSSAGPPGPPGPAGPSSAFVARSPVDLVAMVPIVLGFHPRESLVLLTFGPAGASFHARVDLPGADDDAARAEVLSVLVEAARANDVTTAAVVVLSHEADAARAVGTALADALLDDEVSVIDVVRADGERWWSLRPGQPDGPGHAYDLRCHPFTAERVLEGRAAFRDRDELAASLAPLPGPAGVADRDAIASSAAEFATATVVASGPALGVAVSESARWLRAQVLRRSRGGATSPVRLPVPVAGRICLLVADPAMRDVVCTLLTRERAAAQVPLWSALVRRSPDHLGEGVAAVLALVAWLAGDGALAWCAIDRCLELSGGEEPDVGDDGSGGRALATLVAGLLQGAVSPARWEPPSAAEVEFLAG